jgi:hypothetical protein
LEETLKDIRGVSETEMQELYAEYRASLGRPVPTVSHRQGRIIPGAEIQNGLTSDSLRANTGHFLIVHGDIRAGEVM